MLSFWVFQVFLEFKIHFKTCYVMNATYSSNGKVLELRIEYSLVHVMMWIHSFSSNCVDYDMMDDDERGLFEP